MDPGCWCADNEVSNGRLQIPGAPHVLQSLLSFHAAGVIVCLVLQKHGLVDIPRQNRRLVGEWEVLKSRIAIMHELLHWAAAEDPALACGNGSSSQTAAAAVSIAGEIA